MGLCWEWWLGFTLSSHPTAWEVVGEPKDSPWWGKSDLPSLVPSLLATGLERPLVVFPLSR